VRDTEARMREELGLGRNNGAYTPYIWRIWGREKEGWGREKED
jgi:hypothetical protein